VIAYLSYRVDEPRHRSPLLDVTEAALDHALTVLHAHRQVLLAEPLQPSE
jgi:hypothetical protein